MNHNFVIPLGEVSYLYRRTTDSFGNIFFWKGRVYRGINLQSEDFARKLFDSGLLEELFKKDLIPKTTLTNLRLEGYSLVLEHEMISPEIYSYEMAFEMVKDAAACVLDVAEISKKFGYSLKDCHLQNIMFDGMTPKFVDIGSFILLAKEEPYSFPENEFLESYIYPLKFWSHGFAEIAKNLLWAKTPYGKKIYYSTICLYTKFLPSFVVEKIIRFEYLFDRLMSLKKADFDKYRSKAFLRMIRKFFLVFNNEFDLIKTKKRVEGITRSHHITKWANYHGESSTENVRFKRVIELINTHCKNAQTLVDIAGNQGLLSKNVLSETHLQKVICLDYDELAIDKGYKTSTKSKGLYFACLDFMSPTGFLNIKNPYDRFKSDISLCLALTHHLILTQGYSLDFIVKNLSRITNKFLIIEFMPKGLWSPEYSYQVPEWYTIDWYLKGLKVYFDVISFEEIHENRIMIFCTKKEV